MLFFMRFKWTASYLKSPSTNKTVICRFLFYFENSYIINFSPYNKARILSIAWHRDEEILVTGGIDNIRVWNASSGTVLQRISLGRVDKNKETLVWCLAITADFQIISGDSRGKVSVWNSELATLIKVT